MNRHPRRFHFETALPSTEPRANPRWSSLRLALMAGALVASAGGLLPQEARAQDVQARTADPCAMEPRSPSAESVPFRILINGELHGGAADVGEEVAPCHSSLLGRANIQIRLEERDPPPALHVVGPRTASMGEAVRFHGYTNYSAFQVRQELRILRASAPAGAPPLAVISPVESDAGLFRWMVSAEEGTDAVLYVLRAYDGEGRFDETEPQRLSLGRPRAEEGTPDRSGSSEGAAYGGNLRSVAHIPVVGGAVTVSGEALDEGARVTVMGRRVPVGSDGRFVAREILPHGEHEVVVAVEGADGSWGEVRRDVRVDRAGWFHLGLADLTVGRNSVTGPASLVTGIDSRRYQGDTFVEGRLAFYTRGEVGSRTVLTASADSREGPIREIFSNFGERDPMALLRRLDANVAYPLYGDDGVLLEDAPTEGRFYARLARDDSHVLWGSFQTPSAGTDLIRFQRGLYGAQMVHRGLASTRYGERRNETSLFAADPRTVGSREEFRATGGSLYYLRRQDIFLGSERVFVEVRDRDSGIVLSSTPLVPFEDYELNALQGRLVLRTPLSSVSTTQGLVRDGALHGDPVYLVVNYEYFPTDLSVDRFTTGGRTSHWVGDHVQLGLTGYRQDDGAWDQQLLGGDLTVRPRAGTYLRLERAQSEGRGSPILTSLDGGLSFQTLESSAESGERAWATRVEVATDLSEPESSLPGTRLRGYWEDREDGFAAPGLLAPEGLRMLGGVASVPVGTRLSLEGKADVREGDRTGRNHAVEAGADLGVSPAVSLQSRIRRDYRESGAFGGASGRLSEEGGRTDMVLILGYQPVDSTGTPGWYRLYGLAQGTLASDDDRSSNSRAGAGADLRLTDRLSLSSEVTQGDGGWGGKAETDVQVSDRTSLYLRYLLDADQRGLALDPQRRLSTGGRVRYSDATSVFVERRQESSAWGRSNLLNAFGIDLTPSEQWSWTLQMERGGLSDPTAGDITRSAASIYTGYAGEALRWSGGLEYRIDDSTEWGERTSWLGRSTVGFELGGGWRALGRGSLSMSRDRSASSTQAEYREFVAGVAYRPVTHGRASALFRYTYLHDEASPAQFGPRAQVNPFAQRSHVVAADGTFRLVPRFALGGKLGVRTGEIRERDGNDASWVGSTAWLAIARADLELTHALGILAEYRYLEVTEALDSRSGILVSTYRQLGDHLRIGLGYNFTDYSDDLTDLSYRSQGWFVNLLGSF